MVAISMVKTNHFSGFLSSILSCIQAMISSSTQCDDDPFLTGAGNFPSAISPYVLVRLLPVILRTSLSLINLMVWVSCVLPMRWSHAVIKYCTQECRRICGRLSGLGWQIGFCSSVWLCPHLCQKSKFEPVCVGKSIFIARRLNCCLAVVRTPVHSHNYVVLH